MATVDTRPATLEDAYELAVKMRPADAEEVRASSGQSPLDACLVALAKSSLARVAYINGELACMWGVVRDESSSVLGRGTGCVWAFTTSVVDEYPIAFLKGCVRELAELREHWELLFNCVDMRYSAALRWVDWLGFVGYDLDRYGVEQRPFRAIFLEA